MFFCSSDMCLTISCFSLFLNAHQVFLRWNHSAALIERIGRLHDAASVIARAYRHHVAERDRRQRVAELREAERIRRIEAEKQKHKEAERASEAARMAAESVRVANAEAAADAASHPENHSTATDGRGASGKERVDDEEHDITVGSSEGTQSQYGLYAHMCV